MLTIVLRINKTVKMNKGPKKITNQDRKITKNKIMTKNLQKKKRNPISTKYNLKPVNLPKMKITKILKLQKLKNMMVHSILMTAHKIGCCRIKIKMNIIITTRIKIKITNNKYSLHLKLPAI